jgi:hypothetical protein
VLRRSKEKHKRAPPSYNPSRRNGSCSSFWSPPRGTFKHHPFLQSLFYARLTLLSSFEMSLPSRRDHYAPRLSSFAPQDILHYFRDVKRLFRDYSITSTDQMKQYTCFYVDSDTSDLWRSFPEYNSPASYNDFVRTVGLRYGYDSQARFNLAQLERIVSRQRQSPLHSLLDLGKFYRSFTIVATNLRKDRLATEPDMEHLFIQAFQPDLCAKIFRRLEIKHLDHYPEDSYAVQDVFEAAKFILESRTSSSSPLSNPDLSFEDITNSCFFVTPYIPQPVDPKPIPAITTVPAIAQTPAKSATTIAMTDSHIARKPEVILETFVKPTAHVPAPSQHPEIRKTSPRHSSSTPDQEPTPSRMLDTVLETPPKSRAIKLAPLPHSEIASTTIEPTKISSIQSPSTIIVPSSETIIQPAIASNRQTITEHSVEPQSTPSTDIATARTPSHRVSSIDLEAEISYNAIPIATTENTKLLTRSKTIWSQMLRLAPTQFLTIPRLIQRVLIQNAPKHCGMFFDRHKLGEPPPRFF